jgi:transcriptional regulator with XRE-family HTH domain
MSENAILEFRQPEPDLSVRRVRKAEFGRRLLSAIERQGITQAELARRTGLGRDSISQYTRGKTIPKSRSLLSMAKILQLRPDELYPHHSLDVMDNEDLPQLEIRQEADGMMFLSVNQKVPMETAMEIMSLLKRSRDA